MAKLVDALCSGRSVRKDVLVRIQSWAQVLFRKPYKSTICKALSNLRGLNWGHNSLFVYSNQETFLIIVE